MMDVRADGFRGVEPQVMNEIEIAGRERGRMRADVIRIVAPAVVMDDETNLERLGLVRALPRLAEETGLVVGRETARFADVDFRGTQMQRRRDDGVKDIVRGDDEQVHRSEEHTSELQSPMYLV